MNLKNFRTVAILEGISYLLLAVTMYYKYVLDNGLPNKIVGMIHGVLFILYVIMAFVLRKEQKWSLKTFTIILIASLVPFGAFYVDSKYLRKS